MDQSVIAVYDANILYPAPLRDLFIRIAQAGLVLGRWTDASLLASSIDSDFGIALLHGVEYGL